jgi:DNA-binding MarR family transcriptional regulator
MISAVFDDALVRGHLSGCWAWPLLLGGAMNAITFGTKRAFQGFLRVTRMPILKFGLTAARFDLLSVVFGSERGNRGLAGVRQSDVRRMLGVTAPVVTRMLRALEGLGLVRRWREDDWDRRQIRVALTEQGERCIGQARKVMMRAVRRMVHMAICFGGHRNADARFRHMETFESYLRGLRAQFGDTARLYYAWGHPDD